MSKKLDAVLYGLADWQGRVGIENRLIASLREYLEGAYLAGYIQALLDRGQPTEDLVAQLEERSEKGASR